MRALPVAIVSLLVGGGLGVWSAYLTVGPQRSASDISALRSMNGDTKPVDYPEFKIDATTYDFGMMQRGTSRKHAFKVTNTGSRPLSVEVTSTTCKCTAGDIGVDFIQPGQTVDLRLKWDAKSMPGPFRQSATLSTNDPRARRVELTIEGTVTDVSGVEPQQWVFDKLRLDDERTESVYLMDYQSDDLEIYSAELDREAARDDYRVSFEKVPVSELPDRIAKSGYRVDITPLEGLALGAINDWVVLKSNIKAAEELRVPIFGSVVGDIEIRGPSVWNSVTGAVHLGVLESEQGGEVNLFIDITGDHAKGTEIVASEVSPKYLEVELGEPNELRDDFVRVPLKLRVPQGLPPAIHNGTGQGEAGSVVLKTNHPTSKEISFGVRYTIKRSSITK